MNKINMAAIGTGILNAVLMRTLVFLDSQEVKDNEEQKRLELTSKEQGQ